MRLSQLTVQKITKRNESIHRPLSVGIVLAVMGNSQNYLEGDGEEGNKPREQRENLKKKKFWYLLQPQDS